MPCLVDLLEAKQKSIPSGVPRPGCAVPAAPGWLGGQPTSHTDTVPRGLEPLLGFTGLTPQLLHCVH